MKKVEEMTKLDTGVFTLSLDFELIWGTLDLFGTERFRKACELEREIIIDRLLDLFVEFNLPATWCVVGHLFLERCEEQNGVKHPEIVRASPAWCKGDWFAQDPSGNESDAPLFLGRSLVEKICACPVPQEIGSHSFSHVIFGDAGCSREAAESEIAASIEAAREMGIEMRSFAFPRNEVGHLDVLAEHGFISYRGPEPVWYLQKKLPRALRRAAHLWDVVRAARPPVVMPERTGSGVWNVPGSMIYFPMHGYRRKIPVSVRVKRAVKGLDAAARQKRIFHLWFHPINMADGIDAMFDGLRSILAHASELRDRGELRVLTMKEIVPAATVQAGRPAALQVSGD